MSSVTLKPELRLAFLGSYVPRHCGIATFTRDLADSAFQANSATRPVILAVTDSGGEYEYPSEVKYEIRQGTKGDYARAAEFINYSGTNLVSIQHEYGIFGGDDGAYVLDFLATLRVPALVTLHTVLRHPSASQRRIIRQIARRSAGIVVMSQIAADLLASAHGVQGEKVHIIAHGIPDMMPRSQEQLKGSFGVAGKRMLLTFGLLSPNKGIETVIRALPAIVREFPNVLYFIVGATHPHILRRHGEAYRTTLEQEAERLGVREHVVFRNQFISPEELGSYLQAADIFISPYLNEAQVTSGALSYAMGAGAAVVSTPYWHASELLADGRGSLFPFQDSVELGKQVNSLLGSTEKLNGMRAAAFEFTRSMVWPQIGATYVELCRSLFQQAIVQPPAAAEVPRASSLPDLRLDHLLRMTDDTGLIQHATYAVPQRSSGYCVDDNARALVVALQADRVQSSPETRKLVSTYLSYLLWSQDENGCFRNFVGYDRRFEPGAQSDDCVGRAVWALGSAVRIATDEGNRILAREMLERALPGCRDIGPRGAAQTILGLAHLLSAFPDNTSAKETLNGHAESLLALYQAESSEGWRWFEPALTYDNAIIPLALFTSYEVTGERTHLRVARESLEFLESVCFTEDRLMLVGNANWHSRGGTKSQADEQPIDAAAFVLAYRGAYAVTQDRHYLRRMRQSFTWFLGHNRLGMPLYDFATAGCRDGLGLERPNENQGAESTLSFLIGLLSVLELADEEPELIEHASPSKDS